MDVFWWEVEMWTVPLILRQLQPSEDKVSEGSWCPGSSWRPSFHGEDGGMILSLSDCIVSRFWNICQFLSSGKNQRCTNCHLWDCHKQNRPEAIWQNTLFVWVVRWKQTQLILRVSLKKNEASQLIAKAFLSDHAKLSFVNSFFFSLSGNTMHVDLVGKESAIISDRWREDAGIGRLSTSAHDSQSTVGCAKHTRTWQWCSRFQTHLR